MPLGSLVPIEVVKHEHVNKSILYFFYINVFIYLFMAVLGLRCCTWAFSSCRELGLLFIVVRGLLIVVASLIVGSRHMGFSSCGMWAPVVVAHGL